MNRPKFKPGDLLIGEVCEEIDIIKVISYNPRLRHQYEVQQIGWYFEDPPGEYFNLSEEFVNDNYELCTDESKAKYL